MTTEVLEEAASAPPNGHVQTEAFDIPPAKSSEKVERFADPRREAIRILRDRLERVLQPVDTAEEEGKLWNGVQVVTRKDLEAAIALDLPPASIFAASVRTPAYVYVSAVCPICSIVTEIPLVLGVKVTVAGSSRTLELTKVAKAMPHQCGQARLDDLAPSKPAARGVVDDEDEDLGEDDDEDEPDFGNEPDADDVEAEAGAIHQLHVVAPPAGPPAVEACGADTGDGTCSLPSGHDGDHDPMGLPF